MAKLRAVIFDIDNTLVNRKVAFLRLCHYFIDKYGDKYPYRCSKQELIDYFIEIDQNGYGKLEDMVPKLAKFWKLPLSPQEFIDERNLVFGKMTVPYPETCEVLDILKNKYKLGVITNGFSSVQREKIRTAGIEDYFDDIIVSGELEFEKPDTRIFMLSCEHLKVSPEEAIYVGDYYPNDIAGAMKAKIMPIWICENPDEHREYQGIRVKRLKDILQFL